MFGLFGKKEKGLSVIDNIWLAEEAKFNACLASKQANPNVIFIAWFDQTKIKLEDYFRKNNIEEQVYIAPNLKSSLIDKDLIFVEHHPLASEEERKALDFEKIQITVFSSLDEPIFKLFGADRMVELLKKMGVKDNEMIEDQMVSKSIKRAQEKIASRNSTIGFARSQGGWLARAGVNQE